MQFRDPSLMWSSFKQSAERRLTAASELASQAAAAAQEVISAAAEEESTRFEDDGGRESRHVMNNVHQSSNNPGSPSMSADLSLFPEPPLMSTSQNSGDTENNGESKFDDIAGFSHPLTYPDAENTLSRSVPSLLDSRQDVAGSMEAAGKCGGNFGNSTTEGSDEKRVLLSGISFPVEPRTSIDVETDESFDFFHGEKKNLSDSPFDANRTGQSGEGSTQVWQSFVAPVKDEDTPQSEQEPQRKGEPELHLSRADEDGSSWFNFGEDDNSFDVNEHDADVLQTCFQGSKPEAGGVDTHSHIGEEHNLESEKLTAPTEFIAKDTLSENACDLQSCDLQRAAEQCPSLDHQRISESRGPQIQSSRADTQTEFLDERGELVKPAPDRSSLQDSHLTEDPTGISWFEDLHEPTQEEVGVFENVEVLHLSSTASEPSAHSQHLKSQNCDDLSSDQLESKQLLKDVFASSGPAGEDKFDISDMAANSGLSAIVQSSLSGRHGTLQQSSSPARSSLSNIPGTDSFSSSLAPLRAAGDTNQFPRDNLSENADIANIAGFHSQTSLQTTGDGAELGDSFNPENEALEETNVFDLDKHCLDVGSSDLAVARDSGEASLSFTQTTVDANTVADVDVGNLQSTSGLSNSLTSEAHVSQLVVDANSRANTNGDDSVDWFEPDAPGFEHQERQRTNDISSNGNEDMQVGWFGANAPELDFQNTQYANETGSLGNQNENSSVDWFGQIASESVSQEEKNVPEKSYLGYAAAENIHERTNSKSPQELRHVKPSVGEVSGKLHQVVDGAVDIVRESRAAGIDTCDVSCSSDTRNDCRMVRKGNIAQEHPSRHAYTEAELSSTACLNLSEGKHLVISSHPVQVDSPECMVHKEAERKVFGVHMHDGDAVANAQDLLRSFDPEVVRIARERDDAVKKVSALEMNALASEEKQANMQAELHRLRDEVVRINEDRESMTKNFEELLSKREVSQANISPGGTELTNFHENDMIAGFQVEAVKHSEHSAAVEERCKSLQLHVEELSRERDSLMHERSQWFSKFADLEEKQREANGKAVDAECHFMSVKSERDAAVERCNLLVERCAIFREQLGDAGHGNELGTDEKSGTRLPDASAAHSDRGMMERSLVNAQKKLVEYNVKLEKLAAQRSLYLRQRDDAGNRLRAAGTEFGRMQNTIKQISKERATLQEELTRRTQERDDLRTRVLALTEEAAERNNLVTDLELANKELADAHTTIDGLSKANRDALSRLSALGIANDVANHRNFVLSQDYKAATENCRYLGEALEQKSLSCSSLRSSLNATVAEVTELKTELSIEQEKLKQEVSGLVAERDAVVERHRHFEKENCFLRDQLRKHEDSVASSLAILRGALSESHVSSPHESPSHSSTSLSLLSAFSGLVDSAASAKAAEKEIARESIPCFENLRTVSQEVANTLVSINNLTRKLQIDANETASKHAEMDAELRIVSERVHTLTNENNDLNDAVLSLRQSVKSSESEREELRSSIARTADEFSALQISSVPVHELYQVRDELNSVRSESENAWTTLEKFLLRYNNDQDISTMVSRREDLGGALNSILCNCSDRLDDMRSVEEDREKLAGLVEELRLQTKRTDDDLKAANDEIQRMQRHMSSERDRIDSDLRGEYEKVVSALEKDLDMSQQELRKLTESNDRAHRECENLRDLCSKLTSQFNSRTNELDDAEERIAFLQDQVTSLEDDLDDFRNNSQAHAEESEEARRSEIEILKSDLNAERSRMEELEMSFAESGKELENLKSSLRASSMLAETHRKAAQNLQIAIEQLEAEKESQIERRTATLRNQLTEAQAGGEDASQLRMEAAEAENRISKLKTEVNEQRAALQRLADERVELKLELEEKLSRLNHPDSGDQLVDRRVVRQLLVSYFRVDSLRRREILELMSRMLVFSEEDLTVVGLKRKALIDRIGSVVQSPRSNSAPVPVGSVSEKWIEFLMNESVDEVEQDDF